MYIAFPQLVKDENLKWDYLKATGKTNATMQHIMGWAVKHREKQ